MNYYFYTVKELCALRDNHDSLCDEIQREISERLESVAEEYARNQHQEND